MTMPRQRAVSRKLRFDELEARQLLSIEPHGILIVESGPDPVIRIDDTAPSDHLALGEFQLDTRWSSTATNGGLSQGDPTTLTWSFADDGTNIPGLNGEAAGNSTLIAFLDLARGAGPGGSNLTLRPWFSLFADSFARLSALSGITYVHEPNDDAAAFSNFGGAAPGVLGTRGDIRIGGHLIDGEMGPNTLAYNFFPDNGEMVIDTGNLNFYGDTSGNSVGFRNTVMHEHGHGLGFDHVESSDRNFLMEPFIDTSFDGPQLDDVLALQRGYGDALEKGGGNNTFGTATNLGTINSGQTVSRGTLGNSAVVAAAATDYVSIDDESDVDFFQFTVAANSGVTLTLAPRGLTYQEGPQDETQTAFNSASQSDLTLQLLDRNGTTVLQTANATGLGGSETIANFTLTTAGTYFVRVSGATANRVQLYGLDVAISAPTGVPQVTGRTPVPGSQISTSSVNVDVTFSEAVVGVDATDLVLSGAAATGATVGTPTNTGGNTWRFPVVGLANGALNLSLAPDVNDIEDSQGNDLFPRPTAWSYTVGIGISVFSNSTDIAIPSAGAATPYPSSINVSGVSGTVTKVTATLTNFSHTFPDDVDILLVGPGGQKLVLMSDVGGGADISDLTFVFDDSAATSLADESALTSGAFRPTDVGAGDSFPAPAPGGAVTGTTLGIFNGVNPNGAWSLYVVDDASQDSGSISGGWSLAITTSGGATLPSEGIVSGPGPGQPQVRTSNTAGELLAAFQPYPGFLGEVRVASGDVNGDGTPDILTAVGSALGVGPHVKVFSGTNGAELYSFYAYGFSFNGGVYIGAGDVNGDGRDDIITGADAGAGPHVKVFSGLNGAELFSFYAYGQSFNGGVRVAGGDVNGDGRADIITGAGPGAGPHVKVFSGVNGAELASYYAYGQSFAGGVYVASGDVNNDGRDDIVTGAGPSAGPHVKVFSGANLSELFSFYAFDQGFAGGVRVGAGDLNSDGRADIIAGAGPGAGPHVRAFNGVNLAEMASFYAYPSTFSGGVFVAGVAEGASGLRLADDPLSDIAADSLAIDQLQRIQAAAIERFAAAGLDSSGLDLLRSVRLSVADLSGNLLGLARGGNVTIDRDAAGRGWFIDRTPDADEEFSFVDGRAIASDAAGSVDLLTAVLHELGHVLGLEHSSAGPDDLMLDELRAGVRRLPTERLIDAALASW